MAGLLQGTTADASQACNQFLVQAADSCPELELSRGVDGDVLVKRRAPLPRLRQPQAPLPSARSDEGGLAEYLAAESGGRSPLRYRCVPEGSPHPPPEQFIAWLGRVALAERRGSAAFKSRCRQRQALQHPRWISAAAAYRAAVESLEAASGFGRLCEVTTRQVGLQKKHLGLVKCAKPGLEAKIAVAAEEVVAVEAAVAAAKAALDTAGGGVWAALQEAEVALATVEAELSDEKRHNLHKKAAAAFRAQAGRALEAELLPVSAFTWLAYQRGLRCRVRAYQCSSSCSHRPRTGHQHAFRPQALCCDRFCVWISDRCQVELLERICAAAGVVQA